MKPYLNIFLVYLIFSMPVCRATPPPPNFPAIPNVEKALGNYSAADIFAIVSVNRKKLPEEHIFHNASDTEILNLKQSWQGANQKQNAQILFEIMADSSRLYSANCFFVLSKIMNLSQQDITDAYFDALAGLNEPSDISFLKSRALSLFRITFDVRLLGFEKQNLAEDGEYVVAAVSSDGPPESPFAIPQKRKSKNLLLGVLVDNLKINSITREQFQTNNDEMDSASLKTWIENNEAVIANAGQAQLNSPDWIPPNYNLRTWTIPN